MLARPVLCFFTRMPWQHQVLTRTRTSRQLGLWRWRIPIGCRAPPCSRHHLQVTGQLLRQVRMSAWWHQPNQRLWKAPVMNRNVPLRSQCCLRRLPGLPSGRQTPGTNHQHHHHHINGQCPMRSNHHHHLHGQCPMWSNHHNHLTGSAQCGPGNHRCCSLSEQMCKELHLPED